MKIKSIKKREKSEKVYDILNVKDNHNFLVKTNSGKFVVLHNCFLEVIDDSSRTYDGKFDAAEEMYHAIMNRMVSRFLRRGHLPGLLCMISSPNFPDDFLHKQINYSKMMEAEAKKLNQPNRSGIFWRRRPTWEAKGKKFYPENEYFYIDTENAEILEDSKVKYFLDNIKDELFPLKIDPEVLIQVAQFIKKEKDYAYSSST